MTRATRTWLISYAVAAVIYAAVDAVWIATVANNQYQSEIGHLLAPSFNLLGAALFYLGYVVGIVHYGIRPHDRDATLRQRVAGAALFGLFTYGTWALTALTVLKGFPVSVAAADIAWGVAVCSLVTVLTVAVLRRTRVMTTS